MKKLLLLLTLITISSCSQKINYSEEKEYFEERGIILYYKGSPFSGTLIKINQYGFKEKILFKEGKTNGTFESYYENGQLDLKSTFKEGVLNGPYESYYENGQLNVKTNYKEGVLNGPYEIYYENGQLNVKTNYKGRVVNGPYESYYENGDLIERF